VFPGEFSRDVSIIFGAYIRISIEVFIQRKTYFVVFFGRASTADEHKMAIIDIKNGHHGHKKY